MKNRNADVLDFTRDVFSHRYKSSTHTIVWALVSLSLLFLWIWFAGSFLFVFTNLMPVLSTFHELLLFPVLFFVIAVILYVVGSIAMRIIERFRPPPEIHLLPFVVRLVSMVYFYVLLYLIYYAHNVGG